MGTHLRVTQRELSNENQHVRVLIVFKNLCVLVFWTKAASALEGLSTLWCGKCDQTLMTTQKTLTTQCLAREKLDDIKICRTA